jgi:hypothetical protein
MTTTADLLAEVRRYLSEPSGLRNKVDTHTGTVMSFQYPLKNIQAGARLAAGLQTFYVWDTNEGTQSADVEVIQGASTTVPTDTTVRVSPRNTDFDLLAATNDALTALSSRGLFQVKAIELPFSYTLTGYDLPGATDIESIYEVLQATPGPHKDWQRIHPTKLRFDRTADPTDFPSGQALNVWQTGYQGYEMRVIYKAPFGQLTTLTDDVPTVAGLPATAVDLVALGAAINVMSGREIARNDTTVQGDTRRAAEVPAGAVANSVNGLRALYQQRLQDEVARLYRRYPAYKAG